MQVYYQKDADLTVLSRRTVALIGYGSQGQAHARNLRDSGIRVLVGQRPGGENHRAAIEHGFQPTSAGDAAAAADLIILALPDESMAAVFASEIEPRLHHGQSLGFIHGFNIRFGLLVAPPFVDIIMIAPKGPGPMVREAFLRGGGLACMLAIERDVTGAARQIALAWAAGIGAGRAGIMETSFAAECEADLFGEQIVLCGGVIELMKAAFDVLIENGCEPEVAYYECIAELRHIVDLERAGGLAAMRARISRTAAYGGLTRGPRLIDDRVKNTMREILAEIRSGAFARQWMEECRAGKPHLRKLLETERLHKSEAAAESVRSMTHADFEPASSPGPLA